ncbi:MAG: GTPase Era [Lachnospiraceae bacterium]|nr:GTPase Era [Lachnospiraceae bacterium]
MSNTKSGFVALIGRPNVGKSTLMNKLIGQKIAITSHKPQTTRNKIRTVYTDERGQIVFLDTPGLHRSRNKLGDYMVSVAEHTFKDADLILWLVEPDEKIGAGDTHIMEQLENIKTPIILCINKTDTLKQDEVLPVIAAYSSRMEFAEIIPVSALKGRGCDDLLDTIFKYLPEGEIFYDEDTVTDQPMRQITAELIREKVLRSMTDEVPHGVAVIIDRMEFKKRIVDIDATIICEKDSHKGMIIGKQGAMLKKIGSAARRDIEDLVESQVNLKLWVKVKKDWRDSDMLLKNFGYDKKNIDD